MLSAKLTLTRPLMISRTLYGLMKPRSFFYTDVEDIGFSVQKMKLLIKAVFGNAGRDLRSLCFGRAFHTIKRALFTAGNLKQHKKRENLILKLSD